METILLTCGYCGASIDLEEAFLESRICKCRYCTKSVLIPRDLGRIKNWYNRAEELRAACEFDRAIDVYEKILIEDNTDPQAHWGMALSKCGIEFVLDGKTGEYFPTCHRTTEQTILAEPEYQAALEHAEARQRAVIEAEAQKIHEIQKKILSISKQEQSYDVFISYKEEDEQKNRTKDSVLAQQIYDELKKKNYRVFYARKTLEDKLGSEYEPIIYAALSSAKVMVVVGTSPEHFKATWVRNEWRRFQLMAKDGSKTIIPAYRDMFPDELPPELSALSALDMAKIGFMQELTDSIGRCMSGRTRLPDVSAIDADRLNDNAEFFLNQFDDTDKAATEYEKLTEQYPRDYRGWWGRIVCKTKRFNMPTAEISELIEWYRYVKELAPNSKAAEFESTYVQYLRICANIAAAEDIQRIQAEILNHENTVRGLRSSIQEQKNQIAKAEEVGKQNMARIDGDINRVRASISDRRSRIRTEKIKMGFGWIVLLLGAVIVASGLINEFKFAIVAIGSLVIYGGYSILRTTSSSYIDDMERGIADSEKQIASSISSKESNTKGTNQSIQKSKDVIQKKEAEIQVANQRIEKCKEYLGIGKDEIAKLFFSSMCESVEVSQPSQTKTLELRNAAYGGRAPGLFSGMKQGHTTESTKEETVSFNCPACGNIITNLRSNLLAEGAVTCKHCGSRIEINSR